MNKILIILFLILSIIGGIKQFPKMLVFHPESSFKGKIVAYRTKVMIIDEKLKQEDQVFNKYLSYQWDEKKQLHSLYVGATVEDTQKVVCQINQDAVEIFIFINHEIKKEKIDANYYVNFDTHECYFGTKLSGPLYTEDQIRKL